MKKRVVITGLGAITPIGKTANETWNGIKNKECGVDETCVLCVFCFMLGMLYFRRKLQKKYGEKIEKINAELVNLRLTEEEMRKDFSVSKEKRKIHNITYNSYKKFILI